MISFGLASLYKSLDFRELFPFHYSDVTQMTDNGGFDRLIRGLFLQISLQSLFICLKLPAEHCSLSSTVIAGNIRTTRKCQKSVCNSRLKVSNLAVHRTL